MNKKTIYYIGCVVLFLSLLWVFLPHALHGHAETVLGVGEESLTSHLIDILMGVIGIMIGLVMIIVANKKEKITSR